MEIILKDKNGKLVCVNGSITIHNMQELCRKGFQVVEYKKRAAV